MIYKLANAVSTVSNPDPVAVTTTRQDAEGTFQVEITATATVLLQGRASPEAPWITIVSLTASDGRIVALFGEMRVSITANTGAVSAWLDVPSK